MAIGPKLSFRDDAVRSAEQIIDEEIARQVGCPVVVPTRGLGISRREWEDILRHRYLNAGWAVVGWVEGDFAVYGWAGEGRTDPDDVAYSLIVLSPPERYPTFTGA